MSRRSNSVNPLRAGLTTIEPRLDEFATLYQAQALPLIVRVLSLLDRKIDRELDRNGFAAEGETAFCLGIATQSRAARTPLLRLRRVRLMHGSRR